jgi:hypothetical protein
MDKAKSFKPTDLYRKLKENVLNFNFKKSHGERDIMQDNRIFARQDVKFPIRFLDPNTGREGEAETTDISANGLGLVTEKSLAARTPLEIWLDIPDQHEPLYVRGNVIWAEDVGYSGSGQQRVGVRLERAELMGLARVLWLKSNR